MPRQECLPISQMWKWGLQTRVAWLVDASLTPWPFSIPKPHVALQGSVQPGTPRRLVRAGQATRRGAVQLPLRCAFLERTQGRLAGTKAPAYSLAPTIHPAVDGVPRCRFQGPACSPGHPGGLGQSPKHLARFLPRLSFLAPTAHGFHGAGRRAAHATQVHNHWISAL